MILNSLMVVRIAICIVLVSVQVSAAQNDARSSRNWEAEQLKDVYIYADDITSFFSELSLTYGIPIGLEVATNEYHLTRYSVDFKKGTLAELLTQFVKQNSLYDWKVVDGVVNVFPKEGYRDFVTREFLATTVERFSVKERTSCWNLIGSLATQPETKRILDAHKTTYTHPDPSGFYIQNVGRSFKLDVSDITVKSILNNVVGKSVTAKLWVISRRDDKTLFIDLRALHEDSIGKGWKLP